MKPLLLALVIAFSANLSNASQERCPSLLDFLSKPIKSYKELKSYNNARILVAQKLMEQIDLAEKIKASDVKDQLNKAIKNLNHQLNLNLAHIKGTNEGEGGSSEKFKDAEKLFASSDNISISDLSFEQKDTLKKIIIRKNIEFKINEVLYRSVLHDIDMLDREIAIQKLAHEHARLLLLNPKHSKEDVASFKSNVENTQKKIIQLHNQKSLLLKRLDEITNESIAIKQAMAKWAGISVNLDFYIQAGNHIEIFYSEKGTLLTDDPAFMMFKENILNARKLRRSVLGSPQ